MTNMHNFDDNNWKTSTKLVTNMDWFGTDKNIFKRVDQGGGNEEFRRSSIIKSSHSYHMEGHLGYRRESREDTSFDSSRRKCQRFRLLKCSWFTVATFVLAVLLSHITMSLGIEGCNEAVCASIVSKCTLLKSCDCEIEPTGCSCCKKCFACLEYLQADCCACVGLCPTQNATTTSSLQKSVVSDFPESVPQLWEALMDGDDEQERWNKVTYPVDVLKPFNTKKPKKKPSDSSGDEAERQNIITIQETVIPDPLMTVNCTVAYLRQCMAEKKCEMSCQSMGASAYRWFQDGCCECIGHRCVNYGINESRCADCSFEDEDDVPEEISDEELERLEKEYAEELEALEANDNY